MESSANLARARLKGSKKLVVSCSYLQGSDQNIETNFFAPGLLDKVFTWPFFAIIFLQPLILDMIQNIN